MGARLCERRSSFLIVKASPAAMIPLSCTISRRKQLARSCEIFPPLKHSAMNNFDLYPIIEQPWQRFAIVRLFEKCEVTWCYTSYLHHANFIYSNCLCIEEATFTWNNLQHQEMLRILSWRPDVCLHYLKRVQRRMILDSHLIVGTLEKWLCLFVRCNFYEGWEGIEDRSQIWIKNIKFCSISNSCNDSAIVSKLHPNLIFLWRHRSDLWALDFVEHITNKCTWN